MVRWKGPRVCAAPANGSTTSALNRFATADIDRTAAGLVRRNDEADDIARQRLDTGRPVTRGRRGDRQRMPVVAGQFGDLPRRKAFRLAAEPLGAGFRRQHAPGGLEKIAAGIV